MGRDDLTHIASKYLHALVAGFLIVWGGADYWLGYYPAAAGMAFGGLVLSPLTIWAQRRGHDLLANHLIVSSSSLYIAWGHLTLSRNADFHLYFLPATALGILLFRAEDVRNIALAIGTIIITGSVLLALPDQIYARLAPTSYPDVLVSRINFVAAFALIVIFVAGHLYAVRTLKAKQLEDAKVANAKLNEIFQGMLEGVRIENSDESLARQNQAAIELLSLGDPGRTYRSFLPSGRELAPGDSPSRRAIRTGQPQINELLRIVRHDGSSRWVTTNALPLGARPGPGQDYPQVLTTYLDVTEQRKSLTLFRQTLDSTPDWIFIKDRAHRYLMVNAAYAAALGRTPGAVVGLNDLDLGFTEASVKGDAGANVRGFWADDEIVLASGKVHTVENDPAVIGGISRIFHTIKAPLFEEGQDVPYAVLGICRDITHLKEVERQLVNTSKMASLGQMAGGIAHEINNPLAIIHGRTQLLTRLVETKHDAEPTLLEGLRRINSTVERIAKVIKGLKTFARGAEDDPFELISIESMVEDSLALCSERFRTHGLKVAFSNQTSAALRGNPAQLAQVLINLLNNAHDSVEALANAWIRIEVTTADAGYVDIAVIDSGPGVPKDLIDKIAQPFFTTKPVGRGTGLGLSISRRIVERHGGQLTYDAGAPNSRFVIRLPVAAHEERSIA